MFTQTSIVAEAGTAAALAGALAVGTTSSNSLLGHLELAAAALAKLLYGTANTALLWRKHVLLAL